MEGPIIIVILGLLLIAFGVYDIRTKKIASNVVDTILKGLLGIFWASGIGSILLGIVFIVIGICTLIK